MSQSQPPNPNPNPITEVIPSLSLSLIGDCAAADTWTGGNSIVDIDSQYLPHTAIAMLCGCKRVCPACIRNLELGEQTIEAQDLADEHGKCEDGEEDEGDAEEGAEVGGVDDGVDGGDDGEKLLNG